MNRYLCWLAVLGVVSIPDWASACWPVWGQPLYHHMPAQPLYYAAPVYPPVVVYPAPCQPLPNQSLPGPRIEAVPSVMFPRAAPTPVAETPGPAKPKHEGSDTAVKPLAPPRIEPISPAAEGPGVIVGAPAIKQTTVKPVETPAVPTPKTGTLEAGGPLPPLSLPGETEFKAPKKANPEVIPNPGAIAVPAPAPADLATPRVVSPRPMGTAEPGTTAVPVPAPAPDIIPPMDLPLIPELKKPASLPSLTLPPDTPIGPGDKPDSVSRSSPLNTRGKFDVKVFTAHGDLSDATGYRTVCFYNHTGRDLDLTIEGRAARLPARTYLHARVGPTFSWNHSGQQSLRQSVPEGAVGLDVVFRE